MFAILAEDRSDAEALVILVKHILDRNDLKIHKKGFSGCGELRRKAASHILDFARQGASRFIICHDSDGKNPEVVRQLVREAIGGKVDLKPHTHKIIVPVQELEAWIIADEKAITSAIRTLKIAEVRKPEEIPSPKEWLVAQSRAGGKSRPLYAPAIFNKQAAGFLSIKKVMDKCPSFKELVEFVRAT